MKTAVVATAVVMVGCGSQAALHTANVQYCGRERAAVKHLTDGVNLKRTVVRTIHWLASLTPPATLNQDSSRFPQERDVIELKNVEVIGAKQETDSDLHVIVTDNSGEQMTVELPMAVCDASSRYHIRLAKARAAANAALGAVSSDSYTPEHFRATIVGVVFFDLPHGQRGLKNSVELHPVLTFKRG